MSLRVSQTPLGGTRSGSAGSISTNRAFYFFDFSLAGQSLSISCSTCAVGRKLVANKRTESAKSAASSLGKKAKAPRTCDKATRTCDSH
jgi:hypothetical protein